MELLDLKRASFALANVDPENFEAYIKALWTVKYGDKFRPLGGKLDGGADGIIYPQDSESDLPTYLQASIQKTLDSKIRDTEKRLRETGKQYKGIIFCTNQQISSVLEKESKFSEKYGCKIEIFDHGRLLSSINESDKAINAFKSFVLPILSSLAPPDSPSSTIPENEFLPDASLCVFLHQELKRDQGKSELLESITDSLIFWALNDTGKSANKLMTKDEIQNKILEAVPTVRQFLMGVLDNRLTQLRTNNIKSMRIKYSSQKKNYYLPDETKTLISEQDIQDRLLMNDVINLFQRRITEKMDKTGGKIELIEIATEICLETVHSLFIDHGMKFSLALKNESAPMESQIIEEKLKELIEKKSTQLAEHDQIHECCIHCLNEALFYSTGIEKLYFGHLSRTYITMFIVQNEPRIVEYFKSMSSNFTLYIGTDIIIKCLSELLLDENHQTITNSLRMLEQKGSRLVLTELVVKEVLCHIFATNLEYKYQYLENSEHMKLDKALNIDRPLIRSYFLARFRSDKPEIKNLSWQTYLSFFCIRPFVDTQNDAQIEEFRAFLEKHLRLDYESESDMIKYIDKNQINDLANKIYFARDKKEREEKVEQILCRNSAITVLRVYDKRKEIDDRSTSPYGFKTWWLTDQTKLFPATFELVNKMNGRYMIRLEFILNYLLSKPEYNDVITSYQLIFPTELGIQLSKHIDESDYEFIVDSMFAERIFENSARTEVELGKLSNKLISDFQREY